MQNKSQNEIPGQICPARGNKSKLLLLKLGFSFSPVNREKGHSLNLERPRALLGVEERREPVVHYEWVAIHRENVRITFPYPRDLKGIKRNVIKLFIFTVVFSHLSHFRPTRAQFLFEDKDTK